MDSIVLTDDQYEWGRYYVEHPNLIRIDAEQELTLCAFRTGLGLDFNWAGTLSVRKIAVPVVDENSNDGREILYPAILHFNAGFVTNDESNVLISFYITVLIHTNLMPCFFFFCLSPGMTDIKVKYDILVNNFYLPTTRGVVQRMNEMSVKRGKPEDFCIRVIWKFWDHLGEFVQLNSNQTSITTPQILNLMGDTTLVQFCAAGATDLGPFEADAASPLSTHWSIECREYFECTSEKAAFF